MSLLLATYLSATHSQQDTLEKREAPYSTVVWLQEQPRFDFARIKQHVEVLLEVNLQPR